MNIEGEDPCAFGTKVLAIRHAVYIFMCVDIDQ